MPPPFPTKRMLGIDFFVGTAAEAVAHISKHGGLVVAPAAPSFIALRDDPDYRGAIADADLAIADSGWAVLFWRLLRREKITRISGLALFKALLETADARIPRNLFFILPSENAATKTLEFGRTSAYPITADDCYIAPRYQRSASGPEGPTPRREVSVQLVEPYSSERDQRSPASAQGSGAAGEVRGQRSEVRDQRSAALPSEPINAGKRASGSEGPTARRERLPYTPDLPSPISHLPSTASLPMIEDPALLAILESRKPKHIIIGIGGGMQDKLGSYLKHQLSYHPGIYCIGAAPGFVTGDQILIPMWADRFFVGWMFRIIARPHDYLTRYWKARLLPLLIIKYGTKIPQLRTS